MSIPPAKAALLRAYIGYKCEECKRHEDKCGKLEVHRIKRGNEGGTYILRNVKFLCSLCHKLYHGGEYR